MTADGKALVLGGGGVTGVAWEIGLLYGLAESGVDLTDAGLLVGTSAGSVVAAQVSSGVPLKDLFEAQLAGTTREIAASVRAGSLLKYAVAGLWPGDPQNGRAWLGRQALKAKTVPAAERRAVIAQRVGRDEWPAARLLIPAIEARTGKVEIFDKDSGVSLIDAVAASCAVPLTWPPAIVGDKRYIDGGFRSVANVDLAEGCERLIAIVPITGSVRRSGRPQNQAGALGVPHAVIAPTDAALARMGRNPLDPAFRASAAEAGRAQAAREAEKARAIWG
jgi:NTE family protein